MKDSIFKVILKILFVVIIGLILIYLLITLFKTLDNNSAFYDYCKQVYGETYVYNAEKWDVNQLGSCETIENSTLIKKYFFFSEYYAWQKNKTAVGK